MKKLIVLLFIMLPGIAWGGVSITAMTLIGAKRISRTGFEYTFNVEITNSGKALQKVTGHFSSTGAGTTIVSKTVSLSDLPAGTKTYNGLLVLDQNRRYAFDKAAIKLSVDGDVPLALTAGPGVPTPTRYSLETLKENPIAGGAFENLPVTVPSSSLPDYFKIVLSDGGGKLGQVLVTKTEFMAAPVHFTLVTDAIATDVLSTLSSGEQGPSLSTFQDDLDKATAAVAPENSYALALSQAPARLSPSGMMNRLTQPYGSALKAHQPLVGKWSLLSALISEQEAEDNPVANVHLVDTATASVLTRVVVDSSTGAVNGIDQTITGNGGELIHIAIQKQSGGKSFVRVNFNYKMHSLEVRGLTGFLSGSTVIASDSAPYLDGLLQVSPSTGGQGFNLRFDKSLASFLSSHQLAFFVDGHAATDAQVVVTKDDPSIRWTNFNVAATLKKAVEGTFKQYSNGTNCDDADKTFDNLTGSDDCTKIKIMRNGGILVNMPVSLYSTLTGDPTKAMHFYVDTLLKAASVVTKAPYCDSNTDCLLELDLQAATAELAFAGPNWLMLKNLVAMGTKFNAYAGVVWMAVQLKDGLIASQVQTQARLVALDSGAEASTVVSGKEYVPIVWIKNNGLFSSNLNNLDVTLKSWQTRRAIPNIPIQSYVQNATYKYVGTLSKVNHGRAYLYLPPYAFAPFTPTDDLNIELDLLDPHEHLAAQTSHSWQNVKDSSFAFKGSQDYADFTITNQGNGFQLCPLAIMHGSTEVVGKYTWKVGKWSKTDDFHLNMTISKKDGPKRCVTVPLSAIGETGTVQFKLEVTPYEYLNPQQGIKRSRTYYLPKATNASVSKPSTGNSWTSTSTGNQIQWSGISGTSVKIELVNPVETVATLANHAPNSGSYNVDLSGITATGPNFMIRITDASGNTYYSDPFSIVEPVGNSAGNRVALLVNDAAHPDIVSTQFRQLMSVGGGVDLIGANQIVSGAVSLAQYGTIGCFVKGQGSAVSNFSPAVENAIQAAVVRGATFVVNNQACGAKVFHDLLGLKTAISKYGWAPALHDSWYLVSAEVTDPILRGVFPFGGDIYSRSVSQWDSGDPQALIFRVDNSNYYPHYLELSRDYSAHPPLRYLAMAFSTGWHINTPWRAFPEWRLGKGRMVVADGLYWTYNETTHSGGYIGIAGRQILKNMGAGVNFTY